MAVGTVTGRNARIYMVSHQAGSVSWTNKAANSYDTYGVGDFTLNFTADVIDQPLVGVAGPYRARGPIGNDGSLTISKFGGNMDILLENLIDTGNYKTASKYIAISGSVSTLEATYLSFYLTSCQITGYDVTLGDAGTITNASVDFINLVPHALKYNQVGGTITG